MKNSWGSNSGMSTLGSLGKSNPFTKKETNAESQKTTPALLVKSGLNLKGIAPARQASQKQEILFGFNTGKIFSSTQDPKAPFSAKLGLAIGGLKLGQKAKAPAVQNSQEGDDSTSEAKSELIEKETGEENDEVIIKTKAKLFEFVTTEEKRDWAERGNGELHFNKITNGYRLTMRRKELKTICLNARVFKGMNATAIQKKNALNFFVAAEDNTLKKYMVYVENEATRNKLVEELKAAESKL